MSLSKQLYIIISLIFFMIFAGNFIISVKNTKEYLEIESITKAQDTATSIGMSIKPLIKDKKDPEIESIIKAIANRGFYKEIRLEDIEISFTDEDLITKSAEIDLSNNWVISNVTIDKKYGKIEKITVDNKFENALEKLENSAFESDKSVENFNKYIFIPSNEYIDNKEFEIKFNATLKNETIPGNATLELNKILVKVYREEKFDYVPQWFIDLIHLNMEEKSSEINDGWNKVATVYVSANAGDAYAKLYEQAKGAILYSIIAFAIAIGVLIFFLNFILQPLKMIEKLAMSIATGDFGIIKKLPYTTEIKNVAIAMNDMSTKIEGIIKKLNSNIENMTKTISQDPLTKLEQRQTFETDMKNMFIKKENGYILSLKIDALAEFAKNHSNSQVDLFIKSFANIISTINNEVNLNVKAYRFFGSEFAMIVKNCNKSEIEKITNLLREKFDLLAKESNLSNISNIGATMFNPIGTIPEIINSAVEAREMAKQIGPDEAFIRDESDLARDMDAWRDLIFDIIDTKKFNVGYIGDAISLDGQNRLIMQEAFTSAVDKNGEDIPIGTFISIAEKYNKVIDFDKAVISSVIKHILDNKIEHNISINLSLDSIVDTNFIEWLKKVLSTNQAISKKLVFSITAYGVAKDIEHFRLFAKIVNTHGAQIVIKRFESKFIPLDMIKNLHIDYIRLARDYTNGISSDNGKYAFVESMQDLCNLVNIKLMAENVKVDEDYEIVKKLKLSAASR